jgi:dGTPase
MSLRDSIEEQELLNLNKKASLSRLSKGRLYFEEKSPYRTDFMRDRDRIIHSKAFRRLLYKTQVFIAPDNDHFRTRLTHSLEVMQIATDVARAIRLNRDLVEAIALGHDIGHAPFGHNGEEALNECYKNSVFNGRFKHAEFGLRIIDDLETRLDKEGLNLTWEVRDGILNHSKGLNDTKDDFENDCFPSTLEGKLVRIVDRIAYVSHDFDDAFRSGYIKINNLPSSIKDFLSKGTSFVINFFASDLISNFENYNDIKLNFEANELIKELKNYLIKNLYSNPLTLIERNKAKEKIKFLYFYFLDKSDLFNKIENKLLKIRLIIDHIAGMTDRFALNAYNEVIN